jgi:periplasmic divalent cation tolerance protein
VFTCPLVPARLPGISRRSGLAWQAGPCPKGKNGVFGINNFYKELLMKINFIYMTVGSKEEARKIGKELVTDRLAACVNILDNMNSFYVWEGELQDDTEVVMIAKTTEDRVAALIKKVESLHSYDCPCIVSLPVTGGHQPFMEWIAGEVK